MVMTQANLNGLEEPNLFLSFSDSNGNQGWSDAKGWPVVPPMPYGQGTLRINTGDEGGTGCRMVLGQGLGEGDSKSVNLHWTRLCILPLEEGRWRSTDQGDRFICRFFLLGGTGLEKIILKVAIHFLSSLGKCNHCPKHERIGSINHVSGAYRTDGYDAFLCRLRYIWQSGGPFKPGWYGAGGGKGIAELSMRMEHQVSRSISMEEGARCFRCRRDDLWFCGIRCTSSSPGVVLAKLQVRRVPVLALEIIASGKILIEEGVYKCPCVEARFSNSTHNLGPGNTEVQDLGASGGCFD